MFSPLFGASGNYPVEKYLQFFLSKESGAMKRVLLVVAMMCLVLSVGAFADDVVFDGSNNPGVISSSAVGVSLASLSTEPGRSVGSVPTMAVPCESDKKDATGKPIKIAGCTEHAMPCLSPSDCCSKKCVGGACVQ
jgi:hypothetical protein